MLIDISIHKKNTLNTSVKVWNVLKDIHFSLPIFDQEKEHFYVIGLSRSNRIKYVDVVSIGSAVSTVCEPREVFRMAIHQGVAGGIICAHNHPSGNLNPSENDIKFTKKLKASGEILEINVLDHIVFTDEGYYSFADEYLL